MKKRKVAALLCAVMVFGCVMTGCGGKDSDNTQPNGQGASTEQVQGEKPENGKNMIMGKVTEINGNEITIALVNMKGGRGTGKMAEGEMPEGERPEMPEGERPEMPEGEMPEGERPEGDKGERPEMPEGEMPEGERPEGAEGEMPEMSEEEQAKMAEEMFEETGETKTIVIEDESIIVKNEGGEQVSGSLADIEVESMISLSYDEDENLTQVMIGFGRGRSK